MDSVLTTQMMAAAILWLTTLFCGTIPIAVGNRLLGIGKKGHGKEYEAKRRGSQELSNEADSGEAADEAVLSPQKEQFSRSLVSEKVLSFLMNFGGGVLFATCFVHLLPEVRESFEQQSTQSGDNVVSPTATAAPEPSLGGLPIAELLTCGGFFVVYLLEEVVHLCVSHSHQHQVTKRKRKALRKSGFTNKSNEIDCETAQVQRAILTKGQPPAGPCQGYNYGAIPCCSNDEVVNTHMSSQSASASISSHPIICSEECDDEEVPLTKSFASPESTEALPLFRCLMIVVALSFHSIFEGIAIGLQGTTVHVWQLLVAISVHKLVIAFVVGLDLYSETRSTKRVFVYMSVFSVMSPLGVIVASFTKLQVSSQTTGILTGIATGSVLYITFFEVFPREKQSSKLPGLVQLMAVLLGWALMVLIQYMTEHGH